MTTNRTQPAITRRQLLASSTGLALATGTSATLSGCASIATRVAATSAPEAVRPLIHQMADPAAAVSSGEAWVAFCDALKPLARHVTGPESLGDLQIQTEGIRCLSRLVSLGLDRFLEHGDPRHPAFYDLQTATRKYLGDNPDQTYRGVAIEGSGTYRIRANAAGAAGVEIGLYAGSFRSDEADESGGRRLVDSLDETALSIEDDGSFEVRVGRDPVGSHDDDGARPGNFLRLEDDANALLIRTYFWEQELRENHSMPLIERLDVEEPAPPVDPATVLRGFIATAMFIDGSLDWWNHFEGIKTGRNELIVMPDDGAVQTPTLVQYVNGQVELERDEALLLEFHPGEEPGYWSWVLQNMWGETPDWRDRPVVLNNQELERAADGTIRIVIAHADPGLPNWMDMSGHPRLLLSLRWRGETALPEISTRTVGASGLAALRV
ncbi:MAG: DUF1214 domain-containing protein [bacterium]|nr:hypothetical protein [Deltaproteobacteria bacterium]MCP4906451.1 DUF1214 domain-containing protein [bacterium]